MSSLDSQIKSEPINISFNSDSFQERVLSNLFESPFTMDGLYYTSAESFWQSLRFPEGSDMREKVRQMNGYQAKNASKKGFQVGMTTTYLGKKYIIGSDEHRALMKRALREKFLQNPEIKKVLLSTGDAELTHVLLKKDGKTPVPDSRTLPRKIFCTFLSELRDEFKGSYTPENDSIIERALLISRSVLNQVNGVKDKTSEVLDEEDAILPDQLKTTVDANKLDISRIFSIREFEMKKLLMESGLNLDNTLGFYGEIILDSQDVEEVKDEKVRSLLQDFHINRKGMGKLSSRGKGYYFNFDGLILDSDKTGRDSYSMNPEEYFSNIREYYDKVQQALSVFIGRKISDFSDSERKVFLFVLDHYRNILLFLKSQQLIFSDFENFNRIMSKSPKKTNDGDFEVQLQKAGFFDTPMLGSDISFAIDEELNSVTSHYFGTLIKNDLSSQDQPIDFQFPQAEGIFSSVVEKYGKIFKKFGVSKKYISRFILNTIRVNREADNPIRTLYAGVNFMAGHLNELEKLEDIQIVGMVYGGVEIPYILKYLFSKSRHTKDKKVFMDFLIPPGYSYRGEVPFNLKKEEIGSRNIILVDDNVCSGKSIVYAKGLLSQVADQLFCMVVDSGSTLNEVSVSVLDTIAGFLPMKEGVKGYGSKLPLYLKRRGIIGRV